MADTFVPNPAGLAQLLTSPEGPVYKDLARRVVRVDALAKQLCPVDTGRLRSSIGWRIVADARGLIGFIGTDVKYAGYVHDGTQGGQFITPVTKQALFWPGADHPVGSVTRGATKAQPFLRDALPAAGG